MRDESELDEEMEPVWLEGYSIIPEKSNYRYENAYKIFKKWCQVKNVSTTEKSLLAYFVERNGQLKAAGSLWAEYSMIKSTVFSHDGIDISKFSTLIAYLKRKNVGYKPKKASIFTREDITKFLTEAPDEEFLIYKVAMILGVSGACRREELYNITMNDIHEQEGLIIVKLPNTKTNIQRTFTVFNKPDDKIPYLQILRKYMKLRPPQVKTDHLFLQYRDGKCSVQVVGKGAIGSWPSKIAKFLNLPNPENYTGHSFRSTSATLLANSGVDILGLKRHGGWRSSEVAEGYVEDSLENKIEVAEQILHDKTIQKDSAAFSVSNTNTSRSGISLSNLSNFTINININ